ncbi:CGNR zinc finger domain-containing protein [Kitasatospora sp. NPDC057223]|uniref:CGNR zinc finger domain-containing protein n=1 Tax=Kitasatospora sp. NPDC057223 TaxID=3346055 RepID=UPI003633B2FD
MDGGRVDSRAWSAADGLPLTGEPPALDLVNTTFVRGGARGVLVDALRTPGDLDHWLTAHAPLLGPALRAGLPQDTATPTHLAHFRELRRALREIAAAHTGGTVPGAGAVGLVNASARLAGSWQELDPAAGAPLRAVTRRVEPDPRLAALGELAASGIALFTGEAAGLVRACPAPGCILYFVRSHGRREWCTATCGNRVRVARHSRRQKDGPARP